MLWAECAQAMNKFISRKYGTLLEVMTPVVAKASDPFLRIKKKWDLPKPRSIVVPEAPPSTLPKKLPTQISRKVL